VHLDTDRLENGYPRWHLRPPDEIRRAIGSLGIGPDSTVVVYGRETVVAARVWWVFLYAGVRDVRYLNGGYAAWVRAGYPVETRAVAPPPVAFTAPLRLEILATTDSVRDGLEARRIRLADVRSQEEFAGETSGYDYLEFKGRIPGAVHLGNAGASAALYQNRDGTLRDPLEIRDLWNKRGAGDAAEMVFYCGSGWRSSLAFLYAWVLGMERVRNYSDGWSGWSTVYERDPSHGGITPGWRQRPSTNPVERKKLVQ
ncbi:MAG: sulfurtransferase, partial [Bryobacteraceae bacterium]